MNYSQETIDNLKQFLKTSMSVEGIPLGQFEAFSDMHYATTLGSSAINTMLLAWVMMPNEEILACPVEIDYYLTCCEIQHYLNNLMEIG